MWGASSPSGSSVHKQESTKLLGHDEMREPFAMLIIYSSVSMRFMPTCLVVAYTGQSRSVRVKFKKQKRLSNEAAAFSKLPRMQLKSRMSVSEACVSKNELVSSE